MVDQPFFIPALIIAGLGLPLIFRLVPRNPLYGIRTRATMASDEAWYRVNRIGGVIFVLSAGFYLGFAWRHPAPPGARAGFDLWSPHFWAFATPLAVGFVVGRLLARRS